MSNNLNDKEIKVKIISFAEIEEPIKNILMNNGYSEGDEIIFTDGYFNYELQCMAWTGMVLGDKKYNSYSINGIWSMCTSFCIKDSNKNIYSSYKLI